jgi:hypothetical protein
MLVYTAPLALFYSATSGKDSTLSLDGGTVSYQESGLHHCPSAPQHQGICSVSPQNISSDASP